MEGDIILQSDVYVDSYTSAMNEAGDIILAATTERTVSDIIKADIHDVLTSKVVIDVHKKTVFESIGFAIEDVAVAWFI